MSRPKLIGLAAGVGIIVGVVTGVIVAVAARGGCRGWPRRWCGWRGGRGCGHARAIRWPIVEHIGVWRSDCAKGEYLGYQQQYWRCQLIAKVNRTCMEGGTCAVTCLTHASL